MTAHSASASAPTDSATPSLIARAKAVLKNRPDSEHEMTLNRLVNNIVVLVYFAVASIWHIAEGEALLARTYHLFMMYNAASLLLFAHILRYPGVSVPRRLFAMCMDLSMICYVMHVGDHATALLYPFILWTIFGNGFRFGRKYLLLATVISLVQFGAVIWTTEFWSTNVALSTGLVIGLLILPAYVSVLIRKLSEARDQAESANRAKSMFLASISHELRTPLTAIIGLSELLRETRLNSEQADMNETVRQSGKSLLSLINDILDLSRLEVGSMPKSPQKVDLYRLLHRTVDMVSVPAIAKNVRVHLSIDFNVPRFVEAPLKHLEDSIINLANNAVKFTENGSVHIRASCLHADNHAARIRFEVRDTGIGIHKDAQSRIFERFTQADETIINKFGGTGLGLATVKQMIEDIGGKAGVVSAPGMGSTFWIEVELPFVPAEAASDWKQIAAVLVSTDVKLQAQLEALDIPVHVHSDIDSALRALSSVETATSRRPVIVADMRQTGESLADLGTQVLASHNLHKARIIVVADGETPPSAGDSGEAFTTVLPRPCTSDMLKSALVIAMGPRQPMDESVEHTTEDAANAYNILLADDNKTNQKVIGKVLERAGHRVTVVDNGQLALLLMQDERFDLALFDVNMPVLNGIDAAKLYAFAALGAAPTPIVALTADATPETDARCREAGMADCLVKPIEPRKLVAAVARIVAATAAASTGAPVFKESIPEDTALMEAEADYSALNTAALDDLIDLGGKEFAVEIVLQFASDGARVLLELIEVVEQSDADRFNELVHALRSGAANVGAKRIFELCHRWRAVTTNELIVHGDDYLRTLRQEFENAGNKLQTYLAMRPEEDIALQIRKAGSPEQSRAA